MINHLLSKGYKTGFKIFQVFFQRQMLFFFLWRLFQDFVDKNGRFYDKTFSQHPEDVRFYDSAFLRCWQTKQFAIFKSITWLCALIKTGHFHGFWKKSLRIRFIIDKT